LARDAQAGEVVVQGVGGDLAAVADASRVVAHYGTFAGPEGAAHLPGLDMIALLGGRGTEDRIAFVSWR
jgi:hypothetical protein